MAQMSARASVDAPGCQDCRPPSEFEICTAGSGFVATDMTASAVDDEGAP